MIEIPRPPCTRLISSLPIYTRQPRTRNALQIANHSLVVRTVLQVHAQHLLPIFLGSLVVGDVALFLQNAGNLGLQLRSRSVQLLVAGTVRVADTCKKICYGIGEVHRFPFIPRSLLPTTSASLENLRECLWRRSADLDYAHMLSSDSAGRLMQISQRTTSWT